MVGKPIQWYLARTGALILFFLCSATISFAQEQRNPYTIDDIEAFLEGGVAGSRIVTLTQEECRAFEMDEATETRLSAAGADAQVLDGLREACYIDPDTLTQEAADDQIDPDPETTPEEPSNLSPEVVEIPDQRLRVGQTFTIDLQNHFVDPEQGDMAYSYPQSSNTSIVAVTLNGTSVTVNPLRAGDAIVSVSAMDQEGAEARLVFGVTVEPENRGWGLGYKLLLGGGAASIVGTVAYLLLGTGSDPGPPDSPSLPGHPGLPPGN